MLMFSTNFEDVRKSVHESVGTFQSHMHTAGAKTMDRAMNLYKTTVRGWRHDVRFVGRMALHGDFLTLRVTTDSWLYTMIDKTGARPHVIRPKGNYPLRFRTGHVAKTKPGSLVPQLRGGTASGPEVRAWEVHHPGFEPRRFSETILPILKQKARDEVVASTKMWAPTVFYPTRTPAGFARQWEWKA